MKRYILLFLLFITTGCVAEPTIVIEGVEDGAIYVSKPTIDLIESTPGETTMTLNGEPISDGHQITDNGTYTLSIHRKHLWKESTKDITFTRDDVQPKPPAFFNNMRTSVYYKSVKFDLIPQKDVTYEATLNGNPFDLSEPIEEEGLHTLVITAIKNNGLKSERRLSFTIDNRTYTSKEVEAFTDFIFDNEAHGTLPKVYKWTDSVAVVPHGNHTSEDLESLQQYIDVFNEILPVQFKLFQEEDHISWENRIDVHFVPTSSFKDYGFEGELTDGYEEIVGYAMPVEVTYQYELLTTVVLIGTNTTKVERKTIILHELMHALGLYNHFNDDKSSVLYPYADYYVTELNDYDKKIIELLYREDIQAGMTKPDVERVLKERIFD
ncbi:DUF2927 domain-containing protein [Bacillus timonensis]|nr:DUF2927 domain-containing protein [Bacillus timonensis]